MPIKMQIVGKFGENRRRCFTILLHSSGDSHKPSPGASPVPPQAAIGLVQKFSHLENA